MASLGDAKRGSLLYKPCISPNFETLPPHFIPWHPSPTQHLQRYLRCTSFLFVLCRSLTSFPTPLGFFSWGTFSPVFQLSHCDITSPLYTAATATAPLWSRPSARAGTGHMANTSSCRGATACPPGALIGTGCVATHAPRIWSVSPSDSLPGSVTARGQARQQLTWFALKSSRHAPSGAD